MRTLPTTDRGRATISRVLEAACVLFAMQGIRATTLDDIGAAAMVGRGQLYHFVSDKADLVGEVITFQVDSLITEIQPALDEMATGPDVLAWCEELSTDHASSEEAIRCPIGSLVYELGDADEAPRAALKRGFARWETLLSDALRRVADHGDLRPGADPAALAEGLLAAYQGGMLLANVNGSVEPIRRALHLATTAALSPGATARRPVRRRTGPKTLRAKATQTRASSPAAKSTAGKSTGTSLR